MDGLFQGKFHLEMHDLGVPPFMESPTDLTQVKRALAADGREAQRKVP